MGANAVGKPGCDLVRVGQAVDEQPVADGPSKVSDVAPSGDGGSIVRDTDARNIVLRCSAQRSSLEERHATRITEQAPLLVPLDVNGGWK